MSASPTELEFGYSYLMSHNSDVTLSIDCRFGYERCVGSLSVDVTSGDFIAITGPNGSGKSTIISTIAGELEPLGGFVRVLHREGSFLVDTSSPAAAGCVSRIAEPSFSRISPSVSIWKSSHEGRELIWILCLTEYLRGKLSTCQIPCQIVFQAARDNERI